MWTRCESRHRVLEHVTCNQPPRPLYQPRTYFHSPLFQTYSKYFYMLRCYVNFALIFPIKLAWMSETKTSLRAPYKVGRPHYNRQWRMQILCLSLRRRKIYEYTSRILVRSDPLSDKSVEEDFALESSQSGQVNPIIRLSQIKKGVRIYNHNAVMKSISLSDISNKLYTNHTLPKKTASKHG